MLRTQQEIDRREKFVKNSVFFAIVTIAGCSVLSHQFGEQASEGFDDWRYGYDFKNSELALNEKFCPADNTRNDLLTGLSATFDEAVLYTNNGFWNSLQIEKSFDLIYNHDRYHGDRAASGSEKPKDFIGSEKLREFIAAAPDEKINDPDVRFILAGHAESNMVELYGSPSPVAISQEYGRLAERNRKNNLQVASDRANLAKKLLMARGVPEHRIEIVNHGVKFDKQALDVRICGAGHALALKDAPEPSSTM